MMLACSRCQVFAPGLSAEGENPVGSGPVYLSTRHGVGNEQIQRDASQQRTLAVLLWHLDVANPTHSRAVWVEATEQLRQNGFLPGQQVKRLACDCSLAVTQHHREEITYLCRCLLVDRRQFS